MYIIIRMAKFWSKATSLRKTKTSKQKINTEHLRGENNYK